MMAVVAIQRFDMQRDAGIHRECVEPFAHQVGIELADLVAREVGLEHQHRTPRDIDDDARQRLVHRHVDARIAGDARHVAERLLDRLAERDADIFRGVVVIDMEVAVGLHRDVDARMTRKEIEHVVEKADSGRNRRGALAVEVHRDLDLGFLGLALDRGRAHV